MANRIKTKSRRYYGFFHPILTWEHHCFAYRKGGNQSTTVSDGYEHSASWSGDDLVVTSKEKTHVVRYAYFDRHEEYPKNLLFVLLELLMSFVSILRVTFGKYLLIGLFVLNVVIDSGNTSELSSTIGNAAVTIYVCSFIIPLLGFIVRKAFGLDQKMDDVCEENGWKKWSEYQDE